MRIRRNHVYLVLGILLLIVVNAMVFWKRGDVSRTAPPAPHVASQSSSPLPLPPQPDWSRIPGSLVQVTTNGTVGVLLDEIPLVDRTKFTDELLAKPESFWIDRAKRQIRLTTLRLNFRNSGGKKQLPLPPEEQWNILIFDHPQRMVIGGHYFVGAKYNFSGLLLSDAKSPGETEPVLGTVGGVWNEKFVFPVDPEFIFQRTGFACMNESEFPPNSMDAEEADLFYDDHCTVEKKLSNTGCHQTELPDLSCVQAIDKAIGREQSVLRFERLPWDAALAAKVRTGTVTNPDGPDLTPDRQEFLQHRFTYRYIPQNSCTLEEQCVGAPGWRHLLQFPTADLNAGAKPLEIGLVDYFERHNGSVLSQHGVFEFSACHQHYHFSHYGSFTLGDDAQAVTRKNGFCLQPTARLANNELSPLHHPYTDCLDQGVAVGWIDEYKMGLECQWLDVSDVRSGRDLPLSFTTNPDGMLCEGTLKLDAQGKQLFDPTTFKTMAGGPVDRPQCDQSPGWDANNTESYDVRVPAAGESYVTDDCRDGLYGPLRNCGLKHQQGMQECAPGSQVTVSCSIPAGSVSQVVRICEGSRALGTGIPCMYNDALAAGTVTATKDFTFTCPAARDSVETGGAYAYLSGALSSGEKASGVTCVVKP